MARLSGSWLRLRGLILRKLAFDLDGEIGFGFAASDHGNATFSTNLEVEFEGDFLDFGDR